MYLFSYKTLDRIPHQSLPVWDRHRLCWDQHHNTFALRAILDKLFVFSFFVFCEKTGSFVVFLAGFFDNFFWFFLFVFCENTGSFDGKTFLSDVFVAGGKVAMVMVVGFFVVVVVFVAFLDIVFEVVDFVDTDTDILPMS